MPSDMAVALSSFFVVLRHVSSTNQIEGQNALAGLFLKEFVDVLWPLLSISRHIKDPA
jgi:hypothetical protein